MAAVVGAGHDPRPVASDARTQVEDHAELDVSFPRIYQLLNAGQDLSGDGDGDYEFDTREALGERKHAVPSNRLLECAPLPADIASQAERCTVYSAHGLFPEINRAWMTIDSSVYLWDVEDASDFCVYEELDEVIVSVALVRPKAGVFGPEIEFLLVLATPVMVYLVGVEFSGHALGPRYHGQEISLNLDALYRAPTDNVNLTSIVGTPDGRIFMGGRDGCLYELQYQRTSGWLFTQKCRKINHSSSPLSFLVPTLIKEQLMSSEPVEQLVYDESRRVLYSRTESYIEAWRLEGEANLSHLTKLSVQHLYRRETHGPIVSMHVVPDWESPETAFVAVTTKGSRIYYTSTTASFSFSSTRDHRLFVRVIKDQHLPAPQVHCALYSQGTLMLATSNAGDNRGDAVWCVQAKLFRNAKRQLANQSEVGGLGFLRPSPQQGTKLEETVTVDYLAGKVSDMALLPPQEIAPQAPSFLRHDTDLAYNPLVRQHHPRPQIALLTTKGTIKFFVARPVDRLRHLLLHGSEAEIMQFFVPPAPAQHQGNQWGRPGMSDFDKQAIVQRREACATAFVIICSLDSEDQRLQAKAAAALLRYGGEAAFVPVDAPDNTAMGIGRPALTDRIARSGKHDGLCLYLSRLLSDLWKFPLVITEPVEPGVAVPAVSRFVSRVPKDVIAARCMQLSMLKRFLEDSRLATGISQPQRWEQVHVQRYNMLLKPRTAVAARREFWPDRPGNLPVDPLTARQMYAEFVRMDPAQAKKLETDSMEDLHYVITRLLEALQLWRILCETDVTAVTGDLPEDDRRRLQFMKICDLALTPDGFKLSRLIISKMLSRLMKSSEHGRISAELHAACPILHGRRDVQAAEAWEKLQLAAITKSKEELQHALQLYRQLYQDHEAGPEIHDVFSVLKSCMQHEGVLEGIVTLALDCAAAPRYAAALSYFRNHKPADDLAGRRAYEARQMCYKCITDLLNDLSSSAPSAMDAYGGINSKLDVVVNQVLRSDDELAHVAVFGWFMNQPNGSGRERLVRLESPYLETFLRNSAEEAARKSRKTYREMLEMLYLFQEERANAQRINGKTVEASQSYMQAADLLLALAEGDWDPHEVTLQHRLQYLAKAVTCAKIDTVRIAHAGEILQHLEAKLEVAQLQREILDALADRRNRAPGHGGVSLDTDSYGFTLLQYEDAMRTLNQKLMNISELHEHYTEPFRLKICTLDLVYCSGVNYDWNKLWEDVIVDALQQHCGQGPDHGAGGFSTVLDIVMRVAQKYRRKGSYVPLDLLCQQLEMQAVQFNRGEHHDMVFHRLKNAGFSFEELYDCYYKLHVKQGRDGERLHVLNVICTLLQEWQRSGVSRASVQWRQLHSIAIDDIPRFNEELNGQGAVASQLADKFRQVQRALDVAP